MNNRLPTVYISVEAKQKLDLYIKCATGEISGFGTVLQTPHALFINDVFILKQECSYTETEISEEDASDMLLEMVLDEQDVNQVKLYWHSHVNMTTFWSGTDEKTIKVLSKGTWLLSIVGNKQGTYLTRLDISSPCSITLDNFNLVMAAYPSKELSDQIKDEIKNKVTTPKKNFPVVPYVKHENSTVVCEERYYDA